jgi:hypothetical protein
MSSDIGTRRDVEELRAKLKLLHATFENNELWCILDDMLDLVEKIAEAVANEQ